MPMAVACGETIELVNWLAISVGRFSKKLARSPNRRRPASYDGLTLLHVPRSRFWTLPLSLIRSSRFQYLPHGGPNHCFRLPAYSHRHPRGAGWDDGDGTLLIYFHSYARYTRTEDSPRNRHPPLPRRSDQSNWSDAEVLILRRPADDWSPSGQWVPPRGLPT